MSFTSSLISFSSTKSDLLILLKVFFKESPSFSRTMLFRKGGFYLNVIGRVICQINSLPIYHRFPDKPFDHLRNKIFKELYFQEHSSLVECYQLFLTFFVLRHKPELQNNKN